MNESHEGEAKNPASRRQDGARLAQELFRYLPSGIVVFNHEGRVEDANPAARRALGHANVDGMKIDELFRDAVLLEGDGSVLGTAAALLSETFHSGRVLQRKTLHYRNPAGVRRRLGVTSFPLRQAGAPAGLVCLLTDLTDIHAMEEELNQRRNLSALGEMAAGIAHEFKNSLSTISGYAQMLQSTVPEGEGQTQVRKILEQVTTLANVATEFLTFARPLTVQPEVVNLNLLLSECVESLNARDFPGVEVRVEGDFPAVAGDAVLLTYAFVNLLRNSCEAILQQRQGSQVRVRNGGAAGNRVRILIEDDGPGVAPEVIEKIFIPFFTTKASGTGMGLAMVHKIITAHHGTVRLADAAPGHTAFALELPPAVRS